MSRRQRDRRKIPKSDHRWKVHDDRSGFVKYSDEVSRDLYGVLTANKDVDPFYPVEADQKLNYTPKPIPFIRKEASRYTNNDPYGTNGTLTWENWNTVTWDQWFTKWDKA